MDARITKHRLSNMLSYDWIKILLAIAAAVGVLVMLFTMIATRPTNAQTFLIYGYYGTSSGSDYYSHQDDLKNKNVFSYDILKIGGEVFEGSYSSQVFAARRTTSSGTVMFVSHDKNEEDENATTRLEDLAALGFTRGDKETLLRDPEKFMQDCEAYLNGFFKDGALDEQAVKDCFLSRNGKDKRFRSASQKQKGIQKERERILKLQEDYAAVKRAFDEGSFTYTQVTLESNAHAGEKATLTVAINLSKLSGIENLFYYQKEGSSKQEKENLNLIIFNNGEKKGMSDLKFEAVSYLKYLYDRYTPAAEAE